MNICLTLISFSDSIHIEGFNMKQVKLTKKQELVLNYIKEYNIRRLTKHGQQRTRNCEAYRMEG